MTRAGLQLASLAFAAGTQERFIDAVVGVARRAEDAGFDSLWVGDHFHSNPFSGVAEEPLPEPYTLLAAVAANTRRLSLGTLVSAVTHRNPALLAKAVTTLDVVSGGRAVLGVGAGWNEEDHRAYGLDFPPLRERFDRLDDALHICRAMLSSGRASYTGRRHSVREAQNFPRPLRPGGIPILVGGSGERRTLRLVARHADACNLHGDPATVAHKVAVLRRWCAVERRNPGDITVTVTLTLVVAETASEAAVRAEAVRRERGLDEALFRAAAVSGEPEQVAAQLERYGHAGVDGVIVNLPTPDAEGEVELAAAALMRGLTRSEPSTRV